MTDAADFLQAVKRAERRLFRVFIKIMRSDSPWQMFKEKARAFWELFSSLILRDLLKNRLRTGLTIAGIALGVAILLAINLANQTAVGHFRDSLDRISGKANLSIAASGAATSSSWLKETLLKELSWLRQEGIKLTPVIEQAAVLNDRKNPITVQVLGVDMLADEGFRTYGWELEHPKKNQQRPEQFFSIFERDGIFLGKRLANSYHLKTGDRVPLLINDQQKMFRVSGILSSSGLGGAYGGDLIIMDIATAQEAFALGAPDQQDVGRITRIDAIVPDAPGGMIFGNPTEARLMNLMSRLEATLPAGVEASRPQRRSAQVDKMLKAYQYNLTVLSFIALLVGMFLIYNTMSITVIRRRSEIGTLRALGVSKEMICALFATEAVGLGVAGSLLGIFLGLLFEAGAIQAVSSTVENLYMGIGVKGFSVAPFELIKAFIFGLLVTVLGGLIPVLEAASVQPSEASRRSSYENKIQRVSKRLSWIGGVLAFIALISSQQGPINGLPIFGFLSALCIILSAAFLTPLFLQWALPKLEPIALHYGQQEARLAIQQLRGALGRTSVAIASLMIGIAMMVSLGIMIGSFRETVKTWVNQSLKADLWVEPIAKGAGQISTKLSPAVVNAVKFSEGVQAVDAFYEFPIQFKNAEGQVEPARVGVGQWHVAKEYGGQLKFLDRRPTQEVLQRVLDHLMTDPSVLVTESFATRNKIHQGQMITLDTPAGRMDVRVANIYADYTSDLGYIIMPRELYNLYYDDDSVSGLAVYREEGVSAKYLQGLLQRKLGKQYFLRIRTNEELRNEVFRIFDNTFAITYALHVIAIIVALLGVMNSLLAMVLAAKREFGILKYLGSSRKQIRNMILTQAAVFGVLGNLTGLIVGVLLSVLLVYVINKQSFGWTIQWAPPIDFLLESFLLVLVTSVLSGLFPAKIAAETPAPEVLHAE